MERISLNISVTGQTSAWRLLTLEYSGKKPEGEYAPLEIKEKKKGKDQKECEWIKLAKMPKRKEKEMS